MGEEIKKDEIALIKNPTKEERYLWDVNEISEAKSEIKCIIRRGNS